MREGVPTGGGCRHSNDERHCEVRKRSPILHRRHLRGPGGVSSLREGRRHGCGRRLRLAFTGGTTFWRTCFPPGFYPEGFAIVTARQRPLPCPHGRRTSRERPRRPHAVSSASGATRSTQSQPPGRRLRSEPTEPPPPPASRRSAMDRSQCFRHRASQGAVAWYKVWWHSAAGFSEEKVNVGEKDGLGS